MTIALDVRMRQLEAQVAALTAQLQDYLQATEKKSIRRGRQPRLPEASEPENRLSGEGSSDG